MEYKGIKVEIVKEDDEYCFSFYIGNDLHVGQFLTEEKAIEAVKKIIDEETNNER